MPPIKKADKDIFLETFVNRFDSLTRLSLWMTRWWLKNFQPRSFSRQFKRCLSILLDSNTPGTIAFLCEAFFLCLNVTPHLISIDWCYPQINKQTQLRESWTSTIIVAISRVNRQLYPFLNFWMFIGLFRYVRKFVKLKLPSLHKGQHQPQYFNHLNPTSKLLSLWVLQSYCNGWSHMLWTAWLRGVIN